MGAQHRSRSRAPCRSHLAAKRNSSQRASGGIVAPADPTVIDKARERIDALERIVHGLGDIATKWLSSSRALVNAFSSVSSVLQRALIKNTSPHDCNIPDMLGRNAGANSLPRATPDGGTTTWPQRRKPR